MDPALAYDFYSWQLLYATCAKLLNYPDKPGLAGSQFVPEVAQALPTISDHGKTYTFTIRPGFRFPPPSNTPVTAQTFKYTIERTLNPAMKNPVASEFDDIAGARAYMAGTATHIAGVTAGGNRLTIHMIAPAPDLPARLAQPFFCAVPPNTPINPDGERLIPSAGPYQVASYTPGQGVVLTRNPNYHGTRPQRLARIELHVHIPGRRAIAQVRAGTADYAVNGEVDSSGAATLASRYGPGSPAAAMVTSSTSWTRYRSWRSTRSTPTGLCSPTSACDRPSTTRSTAPSSPGSTRSLHPNRPLPPPGDSRPPRRARLPSHPGPRQSTAPGSGAHGRNRRPLHLRPHSLRGTGTDDQDRPHRNRHPPSDQGIPVRHPVRQVRHTRRTI